MTDRAARATPHGEVIVPDCEERGDRESGRR